MEIEIPKWLTKDYVKLALQNGKEPPEEEAVTVDSIEVDKPIAKGENYLCEIFRVTVQYKKSNDEPAKTSLIVKSPIQGGLHEILKKLGVLQKEGRVYNEYIPRMDKILGGETITPRSYYSSVENIVVLQDLKFNGYQMADRRRQLDYEHCVVALTALAKFHAASVKVHEDDPGFVEEIGKEMFFHEDAKGFNNRYAKINFQLMADQCKKVPELNRYVDRLTEYSENAWDILVEVMKPKENAINVLNHGDFWVNNMLFRYEENKPVDVKIIDLQIVRFTPPSIDLFYFLNSSVQEEVRDTRRTDLLKVYIKELNLNLEKFGSSRRLTEAELKEMMDSTEFFGLLVAISLFPIVIADPKDGVFDMKEATEEAFDDLDTNPLRHYYKGKQFLEIIPKRFKEFENSGWF